MSTKRKPNSRHPGKRHDPVRLATVDAGVVQLRHGDEVAPGLALALAGTTTGTGRPTGMLFVLDASVAARLVSAVLDTAAAAGGPLSEQLSQALRLEPAPGLEVPVVGETVPVLTPPSP